MTAERITQRFFRRRGLKRKGRWAWLCVPFFFLGAGLLLLSGCSKPLPADALVVTQTPLAASLTPQDIMDQKYPAGSRVVLVPAGKSGAVSPLSQGLFAAGAPVVTPKGDRIFFAGKAEANGQWQIYEANFSGGQPKAVTRIQGGAMDPAIISTGELIFSSPVPKVGAIWRSPQPPALYVQAPGGTPRRLTFGPIAALDATVLRDGRVLFVSARTLTPDGQPDLALFTINNDGTEVTAFALDKDGARYVHRPRELPPGRIGFLASSSEALGSESLAQSVRTARPFLSRSNLFGFPVSQCQAVEPDGNGGILACLETRGVMGRAMSGSYAVFRLGPESQGLGEPIFDDPAWNEVEAVRTTAYPPPIAHVSAIMPAKNYATILCLNANYARVRGTNGTAMPKTERIRVLAGGNKGAITVLGEVPVQPDGSFMAEVPTDTPLGFEALGAGGRVLSRSEPFFWARPGENRSCIGCHEPYNRTIRNVRPLAASLPPVVLKAPPAAGQTQTASATVSSSSSQR